MRWTQFLVGACLLLALPAAAQQRIIGFLALDSSDSHSVWDKMFGGGLRELGYRDAKALKIEYRFAHGDVSRYPALAKDLLSRKPELIVAPCGPSQKAIRAIAPKLPLIALCADEINFLGEVASISRPGGYTTGILMFSAESVGKRLEFLREVVPGMSRLAVLHDANDPIPSIWRELAKLQARIGFAIQRLPVSDEFTLDKAFEAARRERAQAFYIIGDNRMFVSYQRIAELARQHRIPTIFEYPVGADAGLLLSYGARPQEFLGKMTPMLVDRVLKGAKPGDLPVMHPTQFEMVVNLKTARELGITIPQSVLLRADRVIE